MKIGLAALVLLLGSISLGQESWTAKSYHILKDGNKLYSECQSYAKDVVVKEQGGDEVMRVQTSAGTDLYPAGACWGYITGIVDTIPAGEGFDPDADVRVSQYIDVVYAYLRDHPEQRHLAAYFLVRTALTDAFPAKH